MLIPRIFWTLLTIESIAAVGIIVAFSKMKSGPEGPVGGWLIFLPPILLAAVAAIFVFSKSDSTRIGLTVLLAMPLVQIVVGPLYSRYQDYQTDRRLQGDDVFRHAAQRDLAHAIKAQDPVKA